nr:putative aldehyde dehydrogenase fus7 [Quercus suber]
MSPSKVSTISWSSFGNVVNGQLRSSDDKHRGTDPVSGELSWDVPIGTQQDVDDAVVSAQKAFESWSETPMEKRKEMLTKYRDLYMSYVDELTTLLMKETGKPVGNHCSRNFPILLAMGKIIPALLTGNTIIVKPSPFTPYTILKCVEIAQEIFAPGVVQAIGGDDKLGPMFTMHPGIAKISFTGSIVTGKKIMAAAASTLKRVTLELGGNDASIVLPDVDVQKIAPELVMGAFQNSGQVCVATKRIYIHENIYEETLKAMVAYVKSSVKTGASDSGALLGPIQNHMQFERVKEFFKDTKPTIIDNPPNDSRIIQEEPFGPIVPTQPWSDEEEVIKRANASNTGLGACVWGKDVARAERIGRKLQAGSIFINSFEKVTPQAFFGGHKESGLGGEWGQEGLKAYCNAQVMHSYKL